MQRRRFLQFAAASAALHGAGAALPAGAEAWPSRPIKLVVTFPAGSSPDIIARLVAEPLGQALGQPVVVLNKAGAGGAVGTDAVAKADADGYTFLFTTQGPLTTSPILIRNLGYDPSKDLAPVSLVATSPNILVTDPALGALTLRDFVRIARENKGKFNYGSIGAGSATHLAMELFKSRAALDMVHVPYQSLPQVVNAIIGGQIQAAFVVPGIAMGQVQAGKLTALAVTTRSRSTLVPELRTVSEQGYPGFEAISWQAILAPAKTPQAIVDRVANELVRIIRSDEVRERMRSQYFSAVGTAPEGLARLMAAERVNWGLVIKAAGVRTE